MNNQDKIIKNIKHFYANHLIGKMRCLHSWEPVHFPSDPENHPLMGQSFLLERKVDYYKLDFIFYNIEKQTCPTPFGEVIVPSLKIRLVHRPTDIESPYKEVINPYVSDFQTICPHHLQPQKYYEHCQHECMLGWILKDAHSPFISTKSGYRLNTKEGYQFEHEQLVMSLLEACALRQMDDSWASWDSLSPPKPKEKQ